MKFRPPIRQLVQRSWSLVLALVLAGVAQTGCAKPAEPNLLVGAQEVEAMRAQLQAKGAFWDAYERVRRNVDQMMLQPLNVPVPKDAGGGYSHEQHKANATFMRQAATLYQLSGDDRYAAAVRDMLLQYADLYPGLPLHPKRREGATNPGRLFWQSLNEAVWLVETSQAFDLVESYLSASERERIVSGVMRPVAEFLSAGSAITFDKIHNHGTWHVAAVGMTGYALGDRELVEQALNGLDKSGKGGFLRQLRELFSPDGYYTEGPYYQRYALMPFVTFAKAIEANDPDLGIFDYRDGVLLKAVDTTIQLSYNGLFFPINDAIKDKGIDTRELVLGLAIAFGITGDESLIEIARVQGDIPLTGDGMKVAQAMDAGVDATFDFRSGVFRDGLDGSEGGLVVMRRGDANDRALVFKPTAQGMGHGHFDKLTWQFYDHGSEIISDYGAARFLNVEAKAGGRYLPENNSYAKQTIAHNTVVINEQSHFAGEYRKAKNEHAEVAFFAESAQGVISSAFIDTAYPGTRLQRTLAMLELPGSGKPLVVDVFKVDAQGEHQLDLPLHFSGQIIDTSFELQSNGSQLSSLGEDHGYQHLWLLGSGRPEAGVARVTWLNDNGRFYSQTSLVDGNTEMLLTQIGANDPFFNLRPERGIIARHNATDRHVFVNVLEPHGEYNPKREFTVDAKSEVASLRRGADQGVEFITIALLDGSEYAVAYSLDAVAADQEKTFKIDDKAFTLNGQFTVLALNTGNGEQNGQ